MSNAWLWIIAGGVLYSLWKKGTLSTWTNGAIPPPSLAIINSGGWTENG